MVNALKAGAQILYFFGDISQTDIPLRQPGSYLRCLTSDYEEQNPMAERVSTRKRDLKWWCIRTANPSCNGANTARIVHLE